MACNRCKRTSSDPFNFLLSCCECGKNWHHRCHIPPLGDPELLALIRATNNNDVDNGLSSWIGRCCKRRRAQSQAIPEAGIRSTPAPAVEAVEVLQPQSRSVSSSVKAPAINFHKAFQQKTSLSSGIATPPKLGDGLTFGDLGPQKPTAHVGSRMMTLVQPAAQHSDADARPGTAPMSPGMAAKDGQLLHPTPLPTPSTRIVPPSLSNGPSAFVPYSRVPHFCESSLALSQSSPSEPAEPNDPRTPSWLFNHSTSLGGASHASTNSTAMDIDPPTLDLRALSLNRAAGPSKARSQLLFHRTAAPRFPSPPPPIPPVKSEDAEMEDLYGAPLGPPSPHAPPPLLQHETRRSPSPFLEYPVEPEPLLLPVLAAKDPHVLEMLERQEKREAARPRQGMCKPQAVRRAGKKRGGFVLVAHRTGAEAARAAQPIQRMIPRRFIEAPAASDR